MILTAYHSKRSEIDNKFLRVFTVFLKLLWNKDVSTVLNQIKISALSKDKNVIGRRYSFKKVKRTAFKVFFASPIIVHACLSSSKVLERNIKKRIKFPRK